MAARTVEILTAKRLAPPAQAMIDSMHRAALQAGDSVRRTTRYQGRADWLLLFGVGYPLHNAARARQLAAGGRCALFDLGYFRQSKVDGYLRVSVDDDHPQRWLDAAPADGSRFEKLRIDLRDDVNPAGRIILAGLGRKSRQYLAHAQHWEERKLAELERRFPGRKILHRPKPKQEFPLLHVERDEKTPIETLLRGAALVVARHSNVLIDAVVAGIPIECEDGAAMWLARRAFTPENRLDFLRRLAWFQWHATEAPQAWRFLKGLGR